MTNVGANVAPEIGVAGNPYIGIAPITHPPGRKTGEWIVVNKRSGTSLGMISWYGAWRQYVFYPNTDTLFNVDCMETISTFIKERMAERKMARNG